MSFKILVIGGLHGNEPLGIEVVQKLQQLNKPNIQAIFGNPEAIKKNQRFVEQDLNRVFPGKANGILEERRAHEIMQIANKFDFVLDFHNTHTQNNNCGFVGGNDYEESLKLASLLGLEKVIVADYNCVNKFVVNCLSIEISLGSELNNAHFWIEKIIKLSEEDIRNQTQKSMLFRFCYRVTREEQNKFQFKNWEAFQAISQADVEKLGLEPTEKYFPIFIDDEYTKEYNFAGLLSKL